MALVVDNLESSVVLLKQIAELSCVDVTVHIEQAMRNSRCFFASNE